MENITFIQTSKDGNSTKKFEAGGFSILTEDIISRKLVFEQFCKSGCKNYNSNGGCPPFSPDFVRLKKIYRNAVLIWVKLDTDQYSEKLLKGTSRFFISGNFQAVSPPVINYFVRGLEGLWNPDMMLGESACKACKPCAFKPDEDNPVSNPKCKNPSLRRYSMESCGIDVDAVMRVGAFPLQWLEFSEKTTIEDSKVKYLVKTSMFLFKRDIPDRNLIEDMKQICSNHNYWSLIA